MFYDDNHISIEDDTNVAFSEDVLERYDAYGWHTQRVESGEDVVALEAAIKAAQAETSRPSIISVRTIIGWPAPNKQNTGKAHGSALGEDEVRATKEVLGFDPDVHFPMDDELLAHVRQVAERHPLIAKHLTAPCGLRKTAGATPFCPEGNRFCGVRVWELPLDRYARVI